MLDIHPFNKIISSTHIKNSFNFSIDPESGIIVQNINDKFDISGFARFQRSIWESPDFKQNMHVMLALNTTYELHVNENMELISFFDQNKDMYGKRFAMVGNSTRQVSDCYLLALFSVKRKWNIIFKNFSCVDDAINWLKF